MTGPDLAQILIANYPYSSIKAQSFNKDSETNKSDKLKNEQYVDDNSMDKFTQYLLGGHIEVLNKKKKNDRFFFYLF